jgi:ribonuclease HI
LLYGLEYLKEMGVMGVKVFDDSMLVVQQIKGDNQCLDGVLNNYRDRCWDVIKTLDEFSISHIPRESNWRAIYLAQQASGYNVVKGMFIIKDNSTVQEGQVGDDK